MDEWFMYEYMKRIFRSQDRIATPQELKHVFPEVRWSHRMFGYLEFMIAFDKNFSKEIQIDNVIYFPDMQVK